VVGLDRGSLPCECQEPHGPPQRVVITGGPGAGKTALLEMAGRTVCEHVVLLPESASIVFGGGFPRLRDDPARRCSQRAIFHVQSDLEALAATQKNVALIVCDRGTLDGLAYWPGEPDAYWRHLRTTREAQLARYAAVLHLQVPPPEHGYMTTPIRIESAGEAARIDGAIARAWDGHPRVEHVPSSADFMDKISAATQMLRRLVPPCCVAGGGVTGP
jgi:predicted ATPase